MLRDRRFAKLSVEDRHANLRANLRSTVSTGLPECDIVWGQLSGRVGREARVPIAEYLNRTLVPGAL